MRDYGLRELQALAESTMEALGAAGLTDLQAEIQRRVIDRSFLEMTECVRLDSGQWRVVYKPFVELALGQIRDTARHPQWTRERKRAWVRWTLLMSGL